MRLVDTNPAVQVAGASPLATRVHYLVGSDPTAWRQDVATYGQVRYTGIYPGIDLMFYGRDRQLEFDFVVSPASDHYPVRRLLELGVNESLRALLGRRAGRDAGTLLPLSETRLSSLTRH